MPTYLCLCRLTQPNVRSMADQMIGVNDAASKLGVEFRDIFVTLGQCDIVLTVEAKDNLSAAAFSMALSASGLKTETLVSVAEAHGKTDDPGKRISELLASL